MADLDCYIPNQDSDVSFITKNINVPFRDKIHLHAVQYWWSLFENDVELPLFSLFNPTKIEPGLLSNIAYIEIIEDHIFRFRVWGTELVFMFNLEMSGLDVREFPSVTCQNHFIELFRMVVEERLPVYSDSKFCYPDGSFVRSEKSSYPLVDQSGAIKRILMLQSFDTSQSNQDRLNGDIIPDVVSHDLETFHFNPDEGVTLSGEKMHQHFKLN